MADAPAYKELLLNESDALIAIATRLRKLLVQLVDAESDPSISFRPLGVAAKQAEERGRAIATLVMDMDDDNDIDRSTAFDARAEQEIAAAKVALRELAEIERRACGALGS